MLLLFIPLSSQPSDAFSQPFPQPFLIVFSLRLTSAHEYSSSCHLHCCLLKEAEHTKVTAVNLWRQRHWHMRERVDKPVEKMWRWLKDRGRERVKWNVLLPQRELLCVGLCLHVDAKWHCLAKPDWARRHQNLQVFIQSQFFSFGRNWTQGHGHRTSFQHVLKTPLQQGAPVSTKAEAKTSKRPHICNGSPPGLIDNRGTLLTGPLQWYNWVIHIQWRQNHFSRSLPH